MHNLQPPTNQLAAVLAAMIDYEGVSEQDTKFNGFRTRISELRLEYLLPIESKQIEFENRFGRKSKYKFHYLNEVDKEAAIEVYNKINKAKNGN